jgi:hypothetical protein
MNRILSTITALLLLAAPLAAHHGWQFDYDDKKPVTVKGTVTKIEWTNPHIHVYLDAKDAQGVITSWNFEMASPLALERGGWSRKSLPIGAEVTIGGYGGKSITQRAIVGSITMADGKQLFVGDPRSNQ